MNYGIVVAGGKSGKKMGGKVDRAFLSLGPKPVLAYALIAYENCEDITGVVVVVRRERVDATRSLAQLFGCSKVIKVVASAALRQNSVQKGLEALPEDAKLVSVHEASRPCVSAALISETLKAAKRYGAASAALNLEGTVMRADRGATANATVDPGPLWLLQTPQSFKIDLLRRAVDKATAKRSITDEADAVEQLGEPVRLVPGAVSNMKIETADDLQLAATLLKL